MSNKKKILVIDDEPYFLDLVKDLLEYEGYEVITASNGEDGLKILRNTLVDVVLLDIMMPKMNGFEFLNIVKVEGGFLSKPPMVVVTAYGKDFTQEQRDAISDVSFVLDKPFDSKKMLKLLHGLLP